MPRYLFRLVVLTAMIFLGGWLGLIMIVSPAYASPLWPPAGLCLAALLLWGNSVWPAVFIGAIANNLLVSSQASDEFSSVIIMSSVLIGSGSTLQALAAAKLSKHWLGSGVPALDSPRTILLFFLLTGPVACLIASSLGVLCLWSFSMTPDNLLAQSWINWWIGDSLGVLIVTPLMFCLFARPRQLWSARRLHVALPLIVTLVALTLTFKLVYQAENARIQMDFDKQANLITQQLVEAAENIVDNSLALRDLFVVSSPVTRTKFTIFSKSILTRHPEVLALQWLPNVQRAELSTFEQQIQSEGYPEFKVVERDTKGLLIPVQSRDRYFPVTFIEPMQDNEKALGLDSTANSLSLESKQRALISGQPSISQRLPLIQRGDAELAVLLSIPVFRTQDQALWSHLSGFVSAVILPTRLIETALNPPELQAFALTLRDLNAPADQAELYRNKVANPLTENQGINPWQYEFSIADRAWQLTIVPDSHFLSINGSMLPWFTLISGLGFTSLLSILLLTISGRAAQIEALIDSRTLDLQQANAKLKKAEHSVRQSETYLRTILNSEPECLILLSRDGLLLDMNPAGLAILEANDLAQVKGINILKLILPKYRRACVDTIKKVFAGADITLQFEITNLQGEIRWLESRAVGLRDSENNIISLLGMARDITEQKQAEEHLKLAARVFGEAHEGILITDAQTNIIDVNPTFCDITGYSREEVIGQKPNLLKSGRQSQAFYQDMWQVLTTTRHWQGEVWNRKKNGDFYAELLSISALCDEEGQIINYVGLFSDITKIKQQQHMLELMAHYDPLTQLPNRTLFADRLLQAIAHSKRDKLLLAVCFLDLDGFKPVNDEFGHEAGDQVLIEVASRIKNNLREEDTVSRHGGDEFALLLTGLHSVDECTQTLSRIHQAIAEPYQINDYSVHIGASSGISIFPLDDADADTLVRHADQAMYQAKLTGKNRYHLFDASHDQLLIDHHKQLHELELAFAEQQFCLYYQPKISLKTGQVTGMEALIRWRHPELGMMAPMSFLPVITNTELEISLGNWVIEQAWQQLVDWQAQGLKIEVSINISAFHLLWSGFVAHLEKTLNSHPQISSHYLQLEILESTALDDLSAVNRIINTCHEVLGIGSALDDFGTGYSSLTHLRHLPVNTVKIDRSFVRDMLDDPDDFAIVESVISLSHAFRNQVVAEGVETEEQGLALLLLNCYVAQGFAIAKPMPAIEVLDWIRHYRPYPAWETYAKMDMSAEQIQIALRRLDLKHWLERVHQCLTGKQNSKANWPIMQPKQSQFGRWLQQVQQQDQYNKLWLTQLTMLHEQLLQQGNGVMHQFWSGEALTARNRFDELKHIQQRLDDCLAKHA